MFGGREKYTVALPHSCVAAGRSLLGRRVPRNISRDCFTSRHVDYFYAGNCCFLCRPGCQLRHASAISQKINFVCSVLIEALRRCGSGPLDNCGKQSGCGRISANGRVRCTNGKVAIGFARGSRIFVTKVPEPTASVLFLPVL